MSLPDRSLESPLCERDAPVCCHVRRAGFRGVDRGAERLGHANIAVTLDIYSKVRPALDLESAERVARELFANRTGWSGATARVLRRCAWRW